MNAVTLFGSHVSQENYPKIMKVIHDISLHGIPIYIYKPFYDILSSFNPLPAEIIPSDAFSHTPTDIIFSIGGDGTFLKCAHTYYTSSAAIVGINMGKLGFLADIMPEQIYKRIQDIQNKKYIEISRTLLEVSYSESYKGIGLNEISLQRSNHLKLIKISVSINNSFLGSFWADGVIISTPTGSTGYSLSLGGPIITPSNNCIVITPIAPHTLNVRPIIIPDHNEITIRAEGEYTDYLISHDYESIAVKESPEITIKKSAHTITTLQFNDSNFFKTLRTKLQLGVDVRK